MRPLLLVLVVTSVLPAEDSVMSGPSMGYVFDGGLRPVLGSPGAAVLGDRIDLGRPLASAVSAPSGTYALAITSDDSSLLLVTFGSPVQQSVLGSATGGRIAFSPDAKSAALFSPGQSGISVWTGLPDNPSSRTADAGGPIAGLALDDTGAVVLAAVQDGDAFRVVRIDTGGVSSVEAAGAMPSIGFQPESTDALVAAGNSADLFHSAGGSDHLAGEDAGVAGVSAVGFLPDSQSAVIVNQDIGALLQIDLGTRTVSTVSCPCRPAVFRRISGKVFQLTDAQDGAAIWFADFSGTDPHVFFVPAGAQP